MNIVKIYKNDDMIPNFTLESENVIDTTNYVSLWDCKEEIYIDEKLIDTKYHTI